MRGFGGFPEGKVPMIAIPGPFFSELLPLIDDLAELKVTLYCFWALQRQRGEWRFVSGRDIEEDSVLLQGLADDEEAARQMLRQGLERAVARGTLLPVRVERDGQRDTWYFMNTPRGRAAVESIRRGELPPQMGHISLEEEEPPRLEAERPNIFVLYEQNIGLLQPLIAEELMEAERTYPASWIEDAFRIAVRQNVRRWSYVRRILERWAVEGKDDGGPPRRGGDETGEADRRRYIEGEYAEYIEH